METVWAEERMGPSGLLPLIVASLALHFMLFFWALQYIRFSTDASSPSETIVQLVEPPAPPRSPSVLFGTKNPKDLEQIPEGKKTLLPPVPRSTQPAPEPSTETNPQPRLIPAPSPESHPAAQPSQQSPLRSQTPPPVAAPQEKGSLPDESAVSSESGKTEVKENILPPSEKNESAPQSSIAGSPGLPFAKPQELERLAKIFTDQEQAKAKKEDPISINTNDLKYYSYGLQVLNKIETVWSYPEEAGRAGIGGEVVVNMMVRRDGSLDDLLLVQSSGYSVLDDEVFRAVRTSSPFGALPRGLIEDPFPMTIHFIYLNHGFFAYRSR